MNFGWFIAEMPLQWYVRAPLHHARRGDVTRAASMAATSIAYLALGACVGGGGGGEPVMCDVLLSVMHTRLFYSVSDEHCGHF